MSQHRPNAARKRNPQRRRTPLAIATLLVIILAFTGCGITIPTDPDGTLGRVTEGQLRVGIADNPPRTVDAGEVSGVEVALVEEFAETIDADIRWVAGSESQLIDGLETGKLDIAIAGFTTDSVWADQVAATRSCMSGTDAAGRTVDYVMFVPLGENAFLVELESFLCAKERAA